jgi:hypothetical protein
METPGRIRAHLKHRDSKFFLRTILLLCVGAITALVAPALILGFFALLFHLWRLDLNWTLCFVAGIAISVPVLMRMEWQAQGPTIDEKTRQGFETIAGKAAPSDYKHLGTFGQVIASQRTPFNGLVELFLIGPNLAVRSMRKLMLRKLAESADFDRAVEIAEILAKLKGGAETEKLRGEKETPQQLSCALAYLIFFDWIGVASDGNKVWILTEARRELARGNK